jgi:hypothetical protein
MAITFIDKKIAVEYKYKQIIKFLMYLFSSKRFIIGKQYTKKRYMLNNEKSKV